MKNDIIQEVSEGIFNPIYCNNIQATKELMELFNKITIKPLLIASDYIKMYNENFYTFETWEELVESEKEQYDGISEEELKEELEDNEHGSIWQLPCGWFVQYI